MRLVYTHQAFKKLNKIGASDLPKVKKKLVNLSNGILVGKDLKGEFSGIKSVRAWPLRIMYRLDTNHRIVILDIDYRGNVYKK